MTCKTHISGAVISFVAVFVLALALLVGCRREPSPEAVSEVIRSATEQELAAFEPQSELEKHLFGHLTFDLEPVEVNENDATEVVHVSNVDLGKAIERANAAVTEGEQVESLGELYQQQEDGQLYDEVRNILYRQIDESKDVVKTDVKLHFKRTGNDWELDETSAQEVANAAFAGLAEAMPERT